MVYYCMREGLAHKVFMANPPKGGGAKLKGLNASKAHGSQLPSGRASDDADLPKDPLILAKPRTRAYELVNDWMGGFYMKKFFLIVALMLAVVSSLVAGTMAAYTQTQDISSGNVLTKQFSISTEES